jgi:hypothetical protein
LKNFIEKVKEFPEMGGRGADGATPQMERQAEVKEIIKGSMKTLFSHKLISKLEQKHSRRPKIS